MGKIPIASKLSCGVARTGTPRDTIHPELLAPETLRVDNGFTLERCGGN